MSEDLLCREEEEATCQSKTIAEHHHLCEREPKTCHPQPCQVEPLASTPEMEMELDLRRKFHFLEAILSSIPRPNIIIWLPEDDKIILVELT